MKLERILKNCQTTFTVENFRNINLKGISNYSTEIKDNFLFGAIKGNKFNGEQFIKDLILFKNLVIVLSRTIYFLVKRSNFWNGPRLGP